MTVTLNPDLVRSIDPPIAEVRTWVEGRQFPAGRPLIDLAQAVPSYPPAGALRQHLAERTALFETAQYTPITGIPPLREALAARMTAEYGGAIAPSNVLITAGCNQAFCVALLTLARSGDEVILPVPYYFNHQMWVQMQGIVPVGLPFRPDRSGVPDPADAARLITERTRAIVLVTPNNPTGATCPPEVLAAFHDLAVSRGIALVLDETYRDFLDTLPAHTLFQDPDWGRNLVQLYSFSKSFSLTGYRVGSLVAGNAVIAQATKVMDTISICASRIAQDGALFGLRELSDWVREKCAMINRRRDALAALFRSNDLGYELISCGAYFAYVRHPFEGEDSTAVARLLADDHNLLCLPGTFFGPDQERCLRLAYANVEEGDIAAVGDRLRESLDRRTAPAA